MIHLIVGPSCAGKTSFVVNQFIHGQTMVEKKDLITYTECPDCYLIGKYIVDGSRTKGTDRTSRKDIPKIAAQVMRLCKNGKDVVLEGDKICSENLFSELEESGEECQLWWVRISKEESIRRNRVNNSTCSDSYLKTVASKAENLFWKFYTSFRGGILDTENIKDFTKLDLGHVAPYFPGEQRGGKMRDDFAVFILTHGRADSMYTKKALENGRYSGKVYYIIDDEDDQREKYEKNFGKENVVVFNKQEAYDRADTMDNFNDHRAIIYARNESFRIAKELGLKYFLMLDDDYTAIDYRYEDKGKLKRKAVPYFDEIFEGMIKFLDESGAATVAFCQGGDFIGGADGKRFGQGCIRKAMNSFFCRTDRPIEFKGTMNEDVVTYTTESSRGVLFLSITSMCVIQKATQSVSGGMTQAYADGGTYLKSFYAVMSMPSAVRVAMLNTSHKRIHHHIDWNACAPKILNERYRKEGVS